MHRFHAQLLLAGETDFLMGYDIQVLKGREQGLPLVTVASSFQFDPQGIMAHDDVADLAALKGKPILIAVHASWCPTCKAQKPILSELTADPKFNNLVYFVVDFDSQKDAVKFFGAREQWLCSKATRKPAARSATPTAPRSPRF